MSKVKLLGVWRSPYSHRIEVALKLKGVEYEFIEQDFTNKSPLLLKSNPVHKKIPVLIHNDIPIAESLVILEYIDETWDGPSILPKDPYERAMARFWARFFDEKCWPTIRKTFTTIGEEKGKSMEEVKEVLNLLDNEVRGKKFFGGDTIGLVDIAGNFFAYWTPLIGQIVGVQILDDEKFPSLCKWIDEHTNCSLIKETLPGKDALTEMLKTRFKPAC